MKQSFVYGDRKIEYTLGYRNRKTLFIEVEAPDTVKVVAPIGTPDDMILETVQNKSKWIINKLYDLREMQYHKKEREFVNGESLLYLGRRYSLQLLLDPSVKVLEVKLIRGQLQVSTPSKEAAVIRQALVNWYRDKAKERINERVTYLQDFL